jgi:hypothetical protein
VTPETAASGFLSGLLPGRHNRRWWLQASAILLLFAVAGLSTGAKDSQYLPSTHPAHYLNISSKMKVSPPLSAFDRTPLHAVAKVEPLRVVDHLSYCEEPPPPAIQLIGLRTSIEDRSPPASAI